MTCIAPANISDANWSLSSFLFPPSHLFITNLESQEVLNVKQSLLRKKVAFRTLLITAANLLGLYKKDPALQRHIVLNTHRF